MLPFLDNLFLLKYYLFVTISTNLPKFQKDSTEQVAQLISRFNTEIDKFKLLLTKGESDGIVE